jgi:hypothetical protein
MSTVYQRMADVPHRNEGLNCNLIKRYRSDIAIVAAGTVTAPLSYGVNEMSDDKKAKAAPIEAPAPKTSPKAKAPKPVKPTEPSALPPVVDAVPAEAVSAIPEPQPAKGDKKDGKPKKDKKEKKKAKKKEKRKKEAVIIRFEDAHLPQIDAKAEALGLSRAAWVRMVVAQALAKG